MQRMMNFWKAEPLPMGTSDAYINGERFPLDLSNPEAPQFTIGFRDRIRQILWLMYRTQFPEPIPRDPEGPSPLLQNVNAFFRAGPSSIQASTILESFSSDVGWGCMIRTGQSMLANTLVRLSSDSQPLMEDIAVSGDHLAKSVVSSRSIDVLREFRDEPDAPYSIHRFVAFGAKNCGKRPGEWFGPSAVATCIAEFAKPQLRTYIAQGMDIYESDITDHAFPVLILCNIRLGINEINPVYYEGLCSLLKNKFSVGVSGGRTSASHYFYGVQGSQLFYQDPHDPKPALTTQSTLEEIVSSLESSVRSLNVSEMDPSMLAGFLLRSSQDFAEFKQSLCEVSDSNQVLHILTKKPNFGNIDLDADFEEDGGGESGSMKATDLAKSETDGGYVVCSTPEPEAAVAIEATKPDEESMMEIKRPGLSRERSLQ